MTVSQKKIKELESKIQALEKSLAVSESSFLKEAQKLEQANKLLAKENTYKAFFYASDDAMLILGFDFFFVDCNESAVKMLRAKNKVEVLNTHPWDLSPEYQPDGRLSSEKAEEMMAAAAEHGTYSFEWMHKRMDGELFPVEVTLTVITVEGQKMFNVSWQDISEKKRAEKELNEYHQHLEELVKVKTKEISVELEKHKRLESDIKQILDASSDAVCVIDKGFNIVYASKSFNSLYKHPGSVIGRKCYDILQEEECNTKDCPLTRILKGAKKFSMEKAFKSKNGVEALYKVDMIPYNDSNGDFFGIIKNYQDITEEKLAAERLAEETREREKLAEKYRMVFESSGDMIVMFDEHGFLDCNNTVVKLLGYSSKEELLKKTPIDITTTEQADGEDSISAVKRHNETTMREGIDCFEWTCKRKDGTTFPVEVMLSRMQYQGRNAMLSVVRDITERKEAEEKLAAEIRERETLAEKYRILFEASGDAITMFDEEGFFDCNKKNLEFLGYSSKEEFIGKTPMEISTAEQVNGQKLAAAYKKHIDKALKEGTDCFEWFCKTKNGTVLPVEVMLSRMEYQGRTVMLSVARDISERKEAEEKLAKETLEREKLAEKYRILFESSGDAIAIFDEKGFLDCNKKNLELMGYSIKEEFIGKNPMEMSTARQANGQELLSAYNEHIRKARENGTDCFEWICIRKDGTTFPIEVMLSRMEYQGRTVMLSVARDISERKEAEEKIRHISAIQKLILENSTLGIALVRNRIFEWVNPRVGELLMLPVEKIQGASTRVIYPSEQVYEELDRMAYPELAGGGRSDNTLQLKRSDGSLFWCRFIGKALDPENIQNGSIWMFEDITEEKEAQRIAEENAQQQGRIEMANNMLHDIGNAMTGISTYVLKPQMEKVWQEIKSLYQLRDLFTNSEDKLIEVFGKEKQRALSNFMKALIASFEERRTRQLEFSGKISSAIGHVCSVLDLQRHYLKESALPLATKINLPTIISDTLVMLSGTLKKQDIEVSFDVEDKNLNISGDQTRLMRVFLNIIKNASEAFDEKEAVETGRILKIALALDKEKEEIKVVFSDNGIGFAAGTGEEFFERGFTSKANGFGIGLHECRSIIESHGGTMTIKSDGINTGAVIVITFPYVDSLHKTGTK